MSLKALDSAFADAAHLELQRLVADSAARFAAAAPVAVDEALVECLPQLVDLLQLDGAILWRHDRAEGLTEATHWVVPGAPAAPAPPDIAAVPWVFSKLEAGEASWCTNIEELPEAIDRETFGRWGVRSGAVVPLAGTDRDVLNALSFGSVSSAQAWPPLVVEQLRLIGGIISQALARQASQLALDRALDELRRLQDGTTEHEDAESRPGIRTLRTSCVIVSDSHAVKQTISQIEQVAATPATVLLFGETGTGKEVFAQAIHDLSPRHHRPMVRVSCAAIPSALIESELFGRERGAYTGALSRQIGRFEAANHSTLFLDEIGELQPEVQIKLLRVLQDHVIERLGSTQPIKVDVRIIAATHRDLEKAVSDGAFREDLYYRLNVFPVAVP